MAGSSSGSRSPECKKKSNSARQAIGNEIMSRTFRRTEEYGRYKFITLHILQKIWTDERLADLFAGTELSGERWLRHLKDDYLKILSILIVMSWKEWPQFKAIFIDHPGRADKDLPLNESAIDGAHFDQAQLQKFVESQSQFLPMTIDENKDIDCTPVFQMPFETAPKTVSDKGSYSSVVEKVVIVSRQYRDREGGPNADPKELIRKLCYLGDDSKQDLSEEKDILSTLRNSLFDDTRVMASLGTMTYLGNPRSLSIFFPVAEFDLDDYLFGRKPSARIRHYPVNPADLMKEFACLAHALNYLHHDIRLDDGEQFVCVHHDLKPDNILVVADGSPVGCWKVTDFGLSRVKHAESKHPQTTLYDHVSSVRASLTSPKRRRGTFQPPEIEKVGEKVMGPKSDIWALGCVLCLVLMYATGGVPGVEAFQDRRLKQEKTHGSSASYEHDYFYRGDDLNPEVLAALEKTSQVGAWAQKCVEIIRRMLQIDPGERPNAKVVQDWLLDRVLKELKEGSAGSTAVRPSKGFNQSIQAVQQTGKGKGPIEDTDANSFQSDKIKWTPYPSSLRPRLSSQFVTFKLENVKQTCLSQFGDYVAFLCERKAYVHSIALLDEHSRWANKQSKSRREGTFLVIPTPENTVWKAMSFPGAFLALRGWNPKEKQDYACVYALTLGTSFKVKEERVHERYSISNLLGIAVSVKGDLALQFASFYEFRSRSTNWEQPVKCAITGLKTVDFTLDGDWLLAWSDDKNSMYSHFWATKDLSDDRRNDRRGSLHNQPRQAEFAVDERLIPHFALPAFVLFDQDPGQVRNIQGQIHPPKEQLSSDYCPFVRAGVVTPASNAIVLARKRDKSFGAVLSLSISNLMQQEDGTLQLQNSRELYASEVKIQRYHKKPCDIAIRVGGDSKMIETIFISYLDGTLEKIECSLPQPR